MLRPRRRRNFERSQGKSIVATRARRCTIARTGGRLEHLRDVGACQHTAGERMRSLLRIERRSGSVRAASAESRPCICAPRTFLPTRGRFLPQAIGCDWTSSSCSRLDGRPSICPPRRQCCGVLPVSKPDEGCGQGQRHVQRLRADQSCSGCWHRLRGRPGAGWRALLLRGNCNHSRREAEFVVE
jgi:hypothetical protein